MSVDTTVPEGSAAEGSGDVGPILTVRGVRKTFEAELAPVRALRGVDLTLAAGPVRRPDGPVGVRQVHLPRRGRRPRAEPTTGRCRWPARPSLGSLDENGAWPASAVATSASSSSSST